VNTTEEEKRKEEEKKEIFMAFYAKYRILKLLSKQFWSRKDLMSQLGINETHIYTCLRDLERGKWIYSTRQGRKKVYGITDLGINLLELLEGERIGVVRNANLCRYLHLKLQAPDVDASEWIKPSALIKEVNDTYQIDTKGHCSAMLRLTLIQLNHSQGVATPIICEFERGFKDPIIKWNDEELKLEEFTKYKLDSSKIFSTSKIKSYFYTYEIYKDKKGPLIPGRVNHLELNYSSRLIVCKLSSKGERHGFCLPVFYGADGAQITVNFPKESIENISANIFKRKWSVEDKVGRWSIWEKTSSNVEVTNYQVIFSYKPSIEEWDNYVVLKRYTPDLLHISFSIKDDNFLEGCAIFKESFKKPLRFTKGENWSSSFFCGNKTCKPPTRP
jgi:DNA-binding PadR family transcriptional regulator